MNINKINNLTNNYTSGFSQTYKQPQENNAKSNMPVSEIPADNIKANYLPTFGRFSKAGNVFLTDRATGNKVKAALKKERIGDYIKYKIYDGKEEAGFMDMKCNSVFPEGDYVLTEPDNTIPIILQLRSLDGDKYSGIGTALVNAAVKESINEGKRGCLWVMTEKGFSYSLSDYRSNQNPIPFYYKLGFRAVSPKIDKFIAECIENEEYDKLPSYSILLLTPEAIRNNKKYFPNV